MANVGCAAGKNDTCCGIRLLAGTCVALQRKYAMLFLRFPTPTQLGQRLSYIMRRMLPIVLHLQHKDTSASGSSPHHDLFFKRIGAAYCAFVEEQERTCR